MENAKVSIHHPDQPSQDSSAAANPVRRHHSLNPSLPLANQFPKSDNQNPKSQNQIPKSKNQIPKSKNPSQIQQPICYNLSKLQAMHSHTIKTTSLLFQKVQQLHITFLLATFAIKLTLQSMVCELESGSYDKYAIPPRSLPFMTRTIIQPKYYDYFNLEYLPKPLPILCISTQMQNVAEANFRSTQTTIQVKGKPKSRTNP